MTERYLSANQFQEVRKFEVIAGRVERDGLVSRRFVSALQRPSLTWVLVAGALDQCGWVPSTMIDVISDGARGMRSLVTSVAPRVSPRILDWFHVSMKLHAIRTSTCAYDYFSERPEIIHQSERLLTKVRDALWRGRGETAIEMLRTMSATLAIASEQLPFFYRLTSGTAYRATGRLLTFLEHNKTDLVLPCYPRFYPHCTLRRKRKLRVVSVSQRSRALHQPQFHKILSPLAQACRGMANFTNGGAAGRVRRPYVARVHLCNQASTVPGRSG